MLEVSVSSGEPLRGIPKFTTDSKLCDNVMVVYVVTGGTENQLLELYEACKPKFLLVGAFPKRNSLAAALEALSSLPRGGLYVIRGESDVEAVRAIAKRASRVVNSKVLLIGGVAPWLVETPSEETLKEKMGLEVIEVGLGELERAHSNSKVSEEEVKSLISGASKVEVDENALTEALKVKEALRALLDSYGANSLAINCFEAIKRLDVTPCLALSLLNSSGTPSACEGDLLSLTSQWLAYVAYGSVGGIFNVVEVLGRRVALAHCTAPMIMLDEYELVRHYETNVPVAVKGKVLPGRSFVALRLNRDLGEPVIWTGESVKGPELDACVTQIWMEVRELYGLRGNHRVLVEASSLAELYATLNSFGIGTDEPIPI